MLDERFDGFLAIPREDVSIGTNKKIIFKDLEWVTVAGTTPVYNVNNGEYTANTDGIYLLSAQITRRDGKRADFYIRVNGKSAYEAVGHSASDDFAVASFIAPIHLDISDTVHVRAAETGTISTNEDDASWYSIKLISRWTGGRPKHRRNMDEGELRGIVFGPGNHTEL